MIFFALYAVGWRAMLRPFDARGRAGFGYVLWVTTVREAVDRLLPVASVGGSVVGVRLMPLARPGDGAGQRDRHRRDSAHPDRDLPVRRHLPP